MFDLFAQQNRGISADYVYAILKYGSCLIM